MTRTLLISLALFVLVPAMATAQTNVYINAVDVSGRNLNELRMTNVEEVFFDEDNNVHVVAPSYQIQMANGAIRCDADAMQRLTGRRYFMVTMPPPDGTVADSITLTINGNEIDTFAPGDPQAVMDVTEYLRLGDNEVVFRSTPQVGMPRSGLEENAFRILVGPGEREAGAIRFDRTTADFTRTGADSAVGEEESFTFQVERGEPE